MSKTLKKKSPGKRNKKDEKPKVGCGLKEPVVVRHKVPPKFNPLSHQSIARLQTDALYSGPPTIHSSLRRGIGSGYLNSQNRNVDWPGMPQYDEQIRSQNQILTEQKQAKQMLQTLSNEVNGLNKDRELLRRATENADKALKKTVDYLAPIKEGNEGVQIRTDGVSAAEPPEEVFLRILSPTKQKEDEDEDAKDHKQDSRMRTPTRKLDYEEEEDNFRDAESVLEMSPPLPRYNPSTIQHTFELNLDGITLQELDQLKKQNEQRIKDIEAKFLQTNQGLENDVTRVTELTKDDQYIIRIRNQLVQVPLNSLAELNADMLNFDTNESDADGTGLHFSKRLIYELKFEKYLKNKIKDEILRREAFKREQYIPPEVRERLEKRAKVQELVRQKLDGKKLSPEEELRLKLQNQAKID